MLPLVSPGSIGPVDIGAVTDGKTQVYVGRALPLVVEEIFAEVETRVGTDDDEIPELAGTEMVELTKIGGYTDSDSTDELESAVAV